MKGDIVIGKRSLPLVIALCVSLLVVGCSWFSGGDEQPKDKAQTPVIEAIEGMKYYVGGPVMHPDKYGRMRMKSFSGEVKNPTGRGLVIGFKEEPNNRYEFRTWVNGMPINRSIGFRDADGLLWHEERFTFNPQGKVVVHQTIEYDDEKQISHSTIEHLDPADGQVLKTQESELPYAPPEDDDDWPDDEDEDGGAEAP